MIPQHTKMANPPTSALRRELGFWDVLLFNIVAVLGPRWVAAAAHNGTSSISLWVLAAVLFFMPTAFILVELSTRFPSEGGLYIWTREAFGDFHGFVAGWSYWVFTLLYFPGLLMASAAMSAYIFGPKGSSLTSNQPFLVVVSLLLLAIAVWLNIVGLNIGKWLQNAGGVGTYVPLVIIAVIAGVFASRHGAVTQLTVHNIMPTWNWGTVNFWSQIAFAFTGMELVCAMSEEVKNPRKTFPRAILVSGILIAGIYIVATIAVQALMNPGAVDPKSGVFQAITSGSAVLGVAWVGILCALMVSVGNAGGVGATVAGVSRVPFVVGIDNYLPAAFGRIHPKWRTPYFSILVQAIISGAILLAFNFRESASGAYQVLVDAATVLYFIPFLYMYASVIKLAYRADRGSNTQAVLIPGGKPGVWIMGLLAFTVTFGSIILACIPPEDVTNKVLFGFKLFVGTVIPLLIGLWLFSRGVRRQRMSAARASSG
ncbi:MAG: APC family permease [Acidobacteriaceae bacterium]